MNKTCARCQKVVYPIEELKCLDKTWHKTCFKCTECGMTLNMKTYKGYNKMPYCEAHIPKAKATAIADTPELKRIAENTKIQSNVKYHADFEKAKGKFTQVADDPETLRIKQNTKHISNVAYHGDLEKKAAMEKQRGSAEVSDSSSNSVYPKRIGSVSDIDPANGIYGSMSAAEQAQQQQKHQQYYQQVQMMQQQEHPPQQQQMRQQPSYSSLQEKQSRQSTALRVYRAIYDYEAQDVDEVSFREGDVIFEVESIDSGWMTGRVERTGKTGMLPANYVEQAVI
ncbi:LIM and SH3 domain protein Lasp isoform X4 [Drosophila subpulchrella]|uniref:LIM and SH3 domain protein Lasp isoform X4 n=1 Tax=Drosophila subpulchrella TaxID=1486046 RepID=UPI0018A138DB|nr:LIM and SH3 domain protein Lasp isoform X4 [Drosophila subpulchrella]